MGGRTPRGPWEGGGLLGSAGDNMTVEQAARGLGRAHRGSVDEGPTVYISSGNSGFGAPRELSCRVDLFLTPNSLLTEKWK